MDLRFVDYLIYIAASIALTVWVGDTLYRNGRPFLVNVFKEDGLADSVNHLLVAGFSLGGSYHYFPSKEHLVLEFYRHTHGLHLAAITPMLTREKDLTARLRGTVRAVVVTCEPFHAVAGSIFSTVANPASPLNPFGGPARPLRDEVVALYAEVVKGSDARIAADIAEMLPLTLWLYQMAILYLWIFDSSPGRLRTLEVIDATSELIVRLLGLANLPV